MQATYRKIKLYVINALMHHDIINIFLLPYPFRFLAYGA